MFTDISMQRQHRQSLQLGLIYVVDQLFPAETLHIPYSIPNGIYCELGTSPVSKREVTLIDDHLRRWVYQDLPLELLGKENGYYLFKLGTKTIRSIYPALDRSSYVQDFRLIPFHTGFVLCFSQDGLRDTIYHPPTKLSATYAETLSWLRHLEITQLNNVNAYIDRGEFNELICLAEALHEKKISSIADAIANNRRAVRVVLVSGPSSSGKTTFTQRLSTQLRVNGLKPVSISLDDYFVDRAQTPRDASGQLDFDALEALDIALLNENIDQLISGEEAELPKYNFVTGQREPFGQFMRLEEQNVLILEGIHALNPSLLTLPTSKYTIFKIYISALFQVNIDPCNRVPTTEARLLRRIVRDCQFRGFPPNRTLRQWESVRRGEDNNVFPFQEEADIMFNSSLLYELNILRPFAEPLLQGIPQDDPNKETADRLLNLLTFFRPLPATAVPFNSILREFIGGSIYSF